MTIRIKNDRIEFTANGSSNTFTLRETANGFSFNGIIETGQIFQDGFQGTVAGFISGAGPTPAPNEYIYRFPFATDTNAVLAGDLSSATSYSAGQSSMTSGYVSGNYGAGGNVIRKFSFASPAAAVQFGSLSSARGIQAGHSSSTDGYNSGGSPPYPPGSNVIDKFPFASDSAATDVGDLTQGRYGPSGHSSTISGYASGGFPLTNTIDKFPFATNSNATDVGDLFQRRAYGSGQSSTTHGYFSGGLAPSEPVTRVNTIDKFPFATDSNATDVGDLTVIRMQSTGQSSTVFGYSSGGDSQSNPSTPVIVNTIDKFPFAADTNATDVGDIGATAHQGSGNQD